jgi:hypothetical protein
MFRFLAGRSGLSFLQSVETSFMAYLTSCLMGTEALSTEKGKGWVKRPGLEADHSPPSSAKVKDEWRYNSTPRVPLFCLLIIIIIAIEVGVLFPQESYI